MSFNRKQPSKSAIAKRPPSNPKYQHVKAVVNSGQSIRRYLENLEEKAQYCKRSQGEDIRRIRLDTFVKLLLQVSIQNRPEKEEENMESTAEIEEKKPYLLLDVRPNDEFAKQHIITAESYPKRLLARVMNYESASMLAYKNQNGHVIIIYDEDETEAKIVALTLTQRGYDNVYLLTGGLKLFRRRFPIDLLEIGSSQRPAINLQNVQQLLSQLEIFETSRATSAASSSPTLAGSEIGKRPWK